jgi:hypothetical protein
MCFGTCYSNCMCFDILPSSPVSLCSYWKIETVSVQLFVDLQYTWKDIVKLKYQKHQEIPATFQKNICYEVVSLEPIRTFLLVGQRVKSIVPPSFPWLLICRKTCLRHVISIFSRIPILDYSSSQVCFVPFDLTLIRTSHLPEPIIVKYNSEKQNITSKRLRVDSQPR